MLKRLSKNGEKRQAPKSPKDRRSMDMMREMPQNFSPGIAMVAHSSKARRPTELPFVAEQESRQGQRQQSSGVNIPSRMPPEKSSTVAVKELRHVSKTEKTVPTSGEHSAESTSQALVRLESSNKKEPTNPIAVRELGDLGDIDTLLKDLTNCRSVLSECAESLTEAKRLQKHCEALDSALHVQSAEIDEYKKQMERFEKLKAEHVSQANELQQYKMHLGSLYSETKVLKEKEETWEKDKRRLLLERRVQESDLRNRHDNELNELTHKMNALRVEKEEYFKVFEKKLVRTQGTHEEQIAQLKKESREDMLKTVESLKQQMAFLEREAATDKTKALEELKSKCAQDRQKQINEHHTERGRLVLEHTKEMESLRRQAAQDKNSALEALRESFLKEKADLLRQINITRSVHQEKPPHWRNGGVDL